MLAISELGKRILSTRTAFRRETNPHIDSEDSEKDATRYSVLGSLVIKIGGNALPPGPPRRQELLGLLIMRPGQVVPVDQLVDELWGECLPLRPTASLHTYVSKLRKTLALSGNGEYVTNGTNFQDSVLRFSPRGYQLMVDPESVDSHVFERKASVDRSFRTTTDVERSCMRLEESLRMWRGVAYSGLTRNPTLESESDRLELLRINAVESLADFYLLARKPDLVASHLTSEVQKYPFREHLVGCFMSALYHLGRQAEALDVYEQTRLQLRSAFGVQPGEELRGIYQAILQQDLHFRQANA
ncbi:AfsR/SARP family transcriptional regulator [Streptomyces cadmiisoli]|uniref:OmpR/PhoB-type domain-containing protein n=1 Tax=Streptomyces cadmiisoli TaxID=2184053 RepID=A0A2Z4JDP4_9ACTN|nr:AfsR/SARP family transcriptional regulator [Streptomyces cadmiisoli]AWW43254.1 hypothetical protein DN051_42480 [Streptomyces cadmiisoli]